MVKWRASLVAQLVKNLLAMQGDPCSFYSWVWKIPWRWERIPTPVFMGFPRGSASKEYAWNAWNLGSIPGLGRSLEEGMATQSSILTWRIPMDRGAWWASLWVSQSGTPLSNKDQQSSGEVDIRVISKGRTGT